MTVESPQSQDLWYSYLRAHTDERTRNLHYSGTLIGIGIFISGLISGQWALLALALVTAYGLAWAGHFLIEQNQPAAFKRPILSFLYNFKMLWLWLKDEIDEEFAKAMAAQKTSEGKEEALADDHLATKTHQDLKDQQSFS